MHIENSSGNSIRNRNHNK